MELNSFGHSCVLLSDGEHRVLIDPGNWSPGWENQEGVDAVLITHAHADHVDFARLPKLLAANPNVRVFAEAQTAASPAAADLGYPIEALEVGSKLAFGGPGSLSVEVLGGEHATIYSEIPQIGNVGLLFTADGRRFFHPGDALTVTPPSVDVLAVPLMAPWMAAKEMVDFVRAIAPSVAVPIHDALLVPTGRALFMNLLNTYGGKDVEVHDFGGLPYTF